MYVVMRLSHTTPPSHNAVSYTRIGVLNKFDLHPVECDYRIIRFNNFCQRLACFCTIAACITGNRSIQDMAHTIRYIARVVYCVTCSCMTAQALKEMEWQEYKNGYQKQPKQPPARRWMQDHNAGNFAF
jgi:hypothetical protein